MSMLTKINNSSCFFISHILLLCLSSLSSSHAEKINSQQTQSFVPVGLVLDLNSTFGAMLNVCIDMAVSDFYSSHPDYATRLQLHKKDAKALLDVDFAVMDLLENEQVNAILGPQALTEEIFVAELGKKVQVPIISFTARSSPIPNIENSFFVRTTQDDSVQAQALAAVCQYFGWTEVVLLYEDTEYGHQFLSHLSNALRALEIELVHLTAFSSSAKSSYISQELSMLSKIEIKVFLVLMDPSLGFRLFALAKDIGMMSEGYAWIISDRLSSFLNSMGRPNPDPMEGVVGVRPYVPFSEELENVQEKWKIESMKNLGSAVMDLNVYGLWAYDTVTALAIAVEKMGPVNSSSLPFGRRLLKEFLTIKLKGLSGDFQLVHGKLKPSSFEIINLVGTGEKRIGLWSPYRGISRELKNVVWPGDSLVRPKGWAIPPTGSLRVGVPWKPGFKQFVDAKINPLTNETEATGFSVDIFLAALNALPFPVNYSYRLYNDSTSTNWSYDSMLQKIPEDYDMVVADTTIWAPRASYVDFALPYLESGVVLVVKNEKPLDMWIFVRPWRWDLWLVIGAACIYMGIVIWILERPIENPAPERLQITCLVPVAALAFPERTLVTNKWSVFVLVGWLFMSFILMQSFTANLSAILTLDQLDFSFSEDRFFGYHEGSFMRRFLIEKLHIKEEKLRAYSSAEAYHRAMSIGSKNGGVDAIFDELPYMKILLNQYQSQYKIVGPTYRTDGLGFAFPIGSPLAAYFSRAILNVTQGPGMTYFELKNFGPGFSSQDPLSSMVSQGPVRLTSRQFAGLFCAVGLLGLIALVCSETCFLSRLKDIFTNRHDQGGGADGDTNGVNPNQGGGADGDTNGVNPNQGSEDEGRAANHGQDGSGGGSNDDHQAEEHSVESRNSNSSPE